MFLLNAVITGSILEYFRYSGGGGDFELFRPKSELWRTVDEITFPHYQYKGDVVGPKN